MKPKSLEGNYTQGDSMFANVEDGIKSCGLDGEAIFSITVVDIVVHHLYPGYRRCLYESAGL